MTAHINSALADWSDVSKLPVPPSPVLADWSDVSKVPVPRRFGTLTAAELDSITFRPVQFVVPGILPEGLTLLAGPPKFGKSFAVMDMAIAVASGGTALGSIKCEAGDVLYLALEDGERRLQDRMRKLCPVGLMPSRLCFETHAPTLDKGLIEALENWVAEHPCARLIVIDTWVHVKPTGTGRASAYDEDAKALRPLHVFAKDHPGLAVVVIHHTRKLDADDVFSTISGTHGLTGMADTLGVMARHGDTAKLCIQGRDVESMEKEIVRDATTGGWRVAGDARERAKTSERQAILDVLADAGGETLSSSQIARAVRKKQDAVSYLLKKLHEAGQIERVRYGKYRFCTRSKPSNSTKSHNNAGDDDDFEDLEEFEGRDDDA